MLYLRSYRSTGLLGARRVLNGYPQSDREVMAMRNLGSRGGMSCMVLMGLCAGALQCAVALAQAAHEGVPRIDPDYATTVDRWWAEHPFNPESPNYRPTIDS